MCLLAVGTIMHTPPLNYETSLVAQVYTESLNKWVQSKVLELI